MTPTKPATCTWTPDDDGNWETDCDQEFVFMDGGPDDNNMRFCCYCGRKLVQGVMEDDNGE